MTDSERIAALERQSEQQQRLIERLSDQLGRTLEAMYKLTDSAQVLARRVHKLENTRHVKDGAKVPW